MAKKDPQNLIYYYYRGMLFVLPINSYITYFICHIRTLLYSKAVQKQKNYNTQRNCYGFCWTISTHFSFRQENL